MANWKRPLYWVFLLDEWFHRHQPFWKGTIVVLFLLIAAPMMSWGVYLWVDHITGWTIQMVTIHLDPAQLPHGSHAALTQTVPAWVKGNTTTTTDPANGLSPWIVAAGSGLVIGGPALWMVVCALIATALRSDFFGLREGFKVHAEVRMLDRLPGLSDPTS